jgi:hypothetical protein
MSLTLLLFLLIIKSSQQDDVIERKEDNNLLVKHLLKLTNQQIVDLSVKNQAIEKRLQECTLNTTIFMNNGKLVLNNNNEEIKLLLSTIYNDLKVALLVCFLKFITENYLKNLSFCFFFYLVPNSKRIMILFWI